MNNGNLDVNMTRLFFRFGKYATLFGNPIHSLTTFNHNVIIDYWWNSEWEKKQQQPAELNWLGIVNKISLFTQTFRCVTNSVKIETNLSALILSFFNVIDKDRHIERSEEKQQRWCLRCKNMRVNWMLSRVPFQIGNFVTFWRNRSHKIGVTWRKAHAALTGSIGWIR